MPQWVVWGVTGEYPKAPYNPESLLRLKTIAAKSGVPETWGTFETAEKCVLMGLARGIGYEFDGQGIYGVDLDNVIDDNGFVTPQAQEIVSGLASYTEVSPSGRGLHIFVAADNVNITRHRKQGGFVEIYSDARYFTVTGNLYGSSTSTRNIENRSTELQRVHDRYLMPKQPAVIPNNASISAQSSSDFLRRGLEKDAVLRACWNGSQRRGDESASDQALMNKLAYWCNADHAAMLTAFTQSPYYNGKDDAHKKKCHRTDYLTNTAKTACATLLSTAYEDTLRFRHKQNKKKVR